MKNLIYLLIFVIAIMAISCSTEIPPFLPYPSSSSGEETDINYSSSEDTSSSSSEDTSSSSSEGISSSSSECVSSSSSEGISSSSSDGTSSSSSDGASSNSSGAENCTAADNTETQYCSNGELKDYGFVEDDDGNIYKTVVIGTQIWMAENLNYATGSSRCYNELESNCNIYGRLYDWATAMDFDESCNSNFCSSYIEAKHRGICPEGWHIPSHAEWDVLSNFIGISIDAKHLKATSGWNSNGNGLDTYGFAALPGGYGSSSFYDVGSYGLWWSSSERSINDGINASDKFMSNYDYTAWFNSNKSYLRSVRCFQEGNSL
jgi:uncharacterized protein (TIGR02145 family)